MSIPLPAQLIALLPLILEFIERFLDGQGILGLKYLIKRLSGDKRLYFRDTFVDAGAARPMLTAINAYFEFEETASDVIKSHLAFMLSLFFALIAKSRDLIKVEGWPVLALVVVTASLVMFLVGLARQDAEPAEENALRPWRRWVWALFLVILFAEAAELLMGEQGGGHR